MNQVPSTFEPMPEWLRKASIAINLLINGYGNNAGTATLSGGTTTTVTDPRATQNSIPLLSPLDNNAYTAAPYVSSRADGSFVLTHGIPAGAATVGYVLHSGPQ